MSRRLRRFFISLIALLILALNSAPPLPAAPANGLQPNLRTGVVTGVSSDGWTTVSLDHTYASMVVVAGANYDAAARPAVVRVSSAAGSSFQLSLDRPFNAAETISADVHYMVVEEGAYTEAEHGVKMEAVKVTATVTDSAGSWAGQSRTYANSYTAPVVVGQVMSSNDEWSTFWASGAAPGDPPSNAAFSAGKMVGEDPAPTRAAEEIGYIVIESGSGATEGQDYYAGVGAAIIHGMDDTPPYVYLLSGLQSASVAITSPSGMDDDNGGWPVIYGDDPLTATSLNLAIDEDQKNDTERSHSAEQAAYIVFGTAGVTNLDLKEIRAAAAPSRPAPIALFLGTLCAAAAAVFLSRTAGKTKDTKL